MPNYCNNIIEVDNVPPIDEMVLFVPYCAVPNGCQSIDVFIKVPNNCYYIAGNENEPPAEGPCGPAGDFQHTINLDTNPDCTDNTPALISKRLDYSEDPNGHILYLYTTDLSTDGAVKGGIKTAKKLNH